MSKPTVPLPVEPTQDDAALQRKLEQREESGDTGSTGSDESAESATEERKIGFPRSGTATPINERDPRTGERVPEDAGEPANPAEHADIQGE